MRVRQLMINRFTPLGVEQSVAAEFWLEGSKLRARYHVPSVRSMMEGEGISVMENDFFPRDGKAFYDSLPLAIYGITFAVRDVER